MGAPVAAAAAKAIGVRRLLTAALFIIAAFAVIIGGFVVVLTSDGEAAAKPCTPGGSVLTVAAPGAGAIGKWTPAQVAIASTIVSTGTQLKMPARAQIIAVMTAMKESSLTNIDHGDAARGDTIGVFQIGPEHGSHADRMNPAWSAQNFYQRLTAVHGWQTMEPTLAAHAAQRNLDPNAYAALWPDALQVVQTLTVPGKTSSASSAASPAAPAGAPGAADAAGATSVVDATGCDTGSKGWDVNAAATYVGPYAPAELKSRAQAFVAANGSANPDPFFHTEPDGSWLRDCQHFVANLSGRASSGYSTAADAWAHFVAAGVAHPAGGIDGHAPPPGAWLYFQGTGAAGHVVVYLGNGQIASTDLFVNGGVGIGPADAVETTWHQTYLGWAAPWGTKVPTAAPIAATGNTSAAGAASASGSVIVAQANIPQRSGMSGYATSMKLIVAKHPDFVTLNEQMHRTPAQLTASAPGYAVYRDPSVGHDPGADQTLDTAILYNTASWRLLTGGRTKLVEDDRSDYHGKIVTWDRFATWGMFQRVADGAIVSVVSTHMPTNPATFGPAKPARQAAYGAGMDTLLSSTVAGLAQRGPVLISGDFNVSAHQNAPWTAPSKMHAAGYAWFTKSVDYVFYPSSTAHLIKSWSGPMVSDHPYLVAQIGLN